jgi:hypothetical protein
VHPALRGGEIAGLPEHQHHLPQMAEVLARLLPQQGAQFVGADVLEIAAEQRLLQFLEAFDLPHQADGVVVAERLRAVKEVAVAALKFFDVADVLQLVEQILEVAARLGVLEVVLLQLLQRLGEAVRQAGEEVPLLLRLRPRRTLLLQGVAFEVEQLIQAPAHLVEGVVEIEGAILLPQLLAQRLQKVVEAHDAHAFPLGALPRQPLERLLNVIGVRQIL